MKLIPMSELSKNGAAIKCFGNVHTGETIIITWYLENGRTKEEICEMIHPWEMEKYEVVYELFDNRGEHGSYTYHVIIDVVFSDTKPF